MESSDVSMSFIATSSGLQSGSREGLFATLSSGLLTNSSTEDELPAWPGFESGFAPRPFLPSPSTSFTAPPLTSFTARPTVTAAVFPPAPKVVAHSQRPTVVPSQPSPSAISLPVPKFVTATRCAQPRRSYCICRKTHMDVFMIQCDICQDWFHGSCVLIDEDQGKDIEKYHCPKCRRF